MAYDKPLPNPTALSAPFWEGTKRRELLVQKCTACGALRWTPQWACRDCYSTEYDWTPDERARRRLHPHHDLPAPVPRLHGRRPLLRRRRRARRGPPHAHRHHRLRAKDVHVGMPVEVAFEDASDKITLYKFKPAR